MKIVDFELRDRAVEASWEDGRRETFHYIWLRDNLPASDNLDPSTGERMRDFHTLPADPKPSSLSLDDLGNLVIEWPDVGKAVAYRSDWLLENAYSEAARAERRSVIAGAEPWTFKTRAEAPVFGFDGIMASPEAELDFLQAFRAFGVAFLTGAPAKPGVVESLARRIGYVREVAFGYIREVRSAPAYDNVAFANHRVPPHIDAVNYAWPYDVQFLHCIANEADGGDSWVVDGYEVAKRLKRQDPEAFDLLTRVKVDYRIGAGSHDVRHAAPVLSLGPDGELLFVRFSNQQRRILSVPHEDVEPFYRAYRAFSAMLNDPANHLSFRFQPGEVMMFNNHRVLHARDSFDPQTGMRHLQLGTTDIDMVDSRIRILSKQLSQERKPAAE